MAYSDYGAFVFKNGERRRDKEDVAAFASDEETFGTDSANIPSGARIFAYILNRKDGANTWLDYIHHGIMGDGPVRVICHKQGLPGIYEATEDGIKKVEYHPDDIDCYDYEPFEYEYKGYKFKFTAADFHGSPYIAEMTEPDGTHWRCEYDCGYGAGFEDEEE